MDNFSISDELRRYLALFWHFAWVLVLCTLLAAGIAYLISVKTTPVYQATTRVLINEAPATKSTDYSSVLTSERIAQTYSELLTSDSVLSNVVMTMSLEMSPAQLKSMILVEPVRDTQLIELKANDTDPVRAAHILNTLVNGVRRGKHEIQGQRFEASKEQPEQSNG